MTQDTAMEVRRAGDSTGVIAISGDITAASEDALMDAYGRAGDGATTAVLLDFSQLEYMNSGGIGLLVTVLVRAQRAKQRLLACGLNDHYRQIFELTRLDEAISIFDDEAAALAAVGELTTMADEHPTSRDDGNWAHPVDRLAASNIPAGALDTASGKQVVSPIHGFGKMWQKTYRVSLTGSSVTPQELIATWKAEFPTFWPKGSQFHTPLTGIAPGEVALLQASVGGGMKLSTGVFVLYADDESFTFMTPQGHMFAGWITFSAAAAAAAAEGGTTVAQCQVLMRAQDPLTEIGLTLGGHKKEDKFWEATLQALASRFGVDAVAETTVVCVDKRRQWNRAGNVRHSSAFRSTIHTATSPLRKR